MPQQVIVQPRRRGQAGQLAIVRRQTKMLLDDFHQWLGADTEQVLLLSLGKQRAVARWPIDQRGKQEQAAGGTDRLDLRHAAPRLQCGGELDDTLLTHLIAARTAEQQGCQIALFRAQPLGMTGQRVADEQALGALFHCQLVELVQLQP